MTSPEPAAGVSRVAAQRWAAACLSGRQVRGRWPLRRRRTLARCAILAALLLILRLPLLDHPTPVDIDEVGFIAALGFPAQYPVHHPGYPLWVAMGTLLHALGLGPYAAFQVWSVAASIIAPLLLYAGLRPREGAGRYEEPRPSGRAVVRRPRDGKGRPPEAAGRNDGLAWWLALAFGVCPLIWFHSATALSYLPAGALGLLVVGLSFQALTARRTAEHPRRNAETSSHQRTSHGPPEPRRLRRAEMRGINAAARGAVAAYSAAAVLAIGISLRADLLLYVGPILAYVAWQFRWRRGLVVALIVAAGVAALIAWTSYLYGRADPTAVRPSLGHTIDVVLGTSVFRLGLVDGLLRNLVKIAVNLAWDFGAAVLLLPVAAGIVIRDIRRRRPPACPADRGEGAGDQSRVSDDPPQREGEAPAEPARREARPPEPRHSCRASVRDVGVILLLWTVPSMAFLTLMHVVQGYFVLPVAAGYCVIGIALQSRCTPRTATVIAAAIALCSAVQFAVYPWSPDQSCDQSRGFQAAQGNERGLKCLLDAKIAFMSAAGLRQIDRRAEIHAPGDYWPTAAHDAWTAPPPRE